MDIYRNDQAVVFPEENRISKEKRKGIFTRIFMFAVMIASVIICAAAVIRANSIEKQYSAACASLQTQLSESMKKNEALVEMLEARCGE